jgi:hypothetical protein
MKRTWTILGRLAAVGVLALLLSGCLKLDMSLDVSADNTVSGDVIFGVDKTILQATGQTADDLLGNNPIAPSGVAGVSSKPYEDDKFVGQEVTFDSVPISQFSQSQDSDSLKITRNGDRFEVSGVLDLSQGTTGETGDPSLDQIVQQALQTADIKIVMSFPGEVVSSNGQVDGNTVTWTPKIGERTELTATASASGGSSFPWLWIVIGVAVLVVVAIVAIALSRRGRGAPQPVAAGTWDAAPATTAPGAPSATTVPPAEPMPPSSAPPAEPMPPASAPVEPGPTQTTPADETPAPGSLPPPPEQS